MSFGYDPELPAGFQDADIEQAEFEAESRRYAYDIRTMQRLVAEGQLAEAADACPHGSGFPLSSPAAEDEHDPHAGESGWRCTECGSRLTASPWDGGTVDEPCEVR